MKYTSALLSILALTLSTSNAQSFNDVPECASKPALAAFTSSGCSLTDLPCICKNQNFISSLLPVVKNACPPEDLKSVPITISTSSIASSPTSTLAGGTAAPSGSGGPSVPGNSTGGPLTSPSPSPQAAPFSGAVGLMEETGMLGSMVGALVACGAVLL
ncbi:MAG: hypothetical protein Q9179_005938 [Wetmoreana sp. 5 TL-2023]